MTWPDAVVWAAGLIGAGVAVAGFWLSYGLAEIGEGLKRIGLGLETAARLRGGEDGDRG